MNLPEIGPGLVLAIGKTNYRVGMCDAEGNLEEAPIIPTPSTAEEFFRESVGYLLHSAHNQGAKWGLIGVPGPVWEADDGDGRHDQRFRITNIPALSRKDGFDAVAEMAAIDPAVLDLADDPNYTLLDVNDGPLAAQAGARLFGAEHEYNIVGNVINGSGTGGAVVMRDQNFPGSGLFHSVPGRWEVGHSPYSLSFPTVTPEKLISGMGIAARCGGRSAEELAANDPIFLEVAHGMGKIIIDLGINAGAEMVVISGGIGIARQDDYEEGLLNVLDAFANSDNPMSDTVPEVRFPSPKLVDTYEMHGAPGVILSHLTSKKIGELIAAAP